MDRLSIDVVHAWRSFRARPAATLALVAVIALGIGMTSTMFALADPFLLRPLPYANPDRLVLIRADFAPSQSGTPRIPNLAEWQSRRDLFTSVAAYGESVDYRVQTSSGALLLKTIPVSSNFFDVLGVRFRPHGEWVAEGDSVHVALVEGRATSTTPVAVGQSVQIEGGGRLRVVGALGDDFIFPTPRATRRPDAVQAAILDEAIIAGTEGRTMFLTGVGRLAPGISPQAASAALTASAGAGIVVTARRLRDVLTSRLRPLALGALVAALFIALACAANVVNLMVTRSLYRTREFSAREAIGATTWDLRRLILIEISAVTVLAIVVSLVLVVYALRMIGYVIPAEYSYLGRAALSFRVVAFASVIGAGVLVSGFAGACITSRQWNAAINETLAAEARKVRWTRFVMVAAQCATAMVLLAGGVFLTRSYINLWNQDDGFSRDTIIVSVVYQRELAAATLARQIGATVDRLHFIPGVLSAGSTSGPLLDDSGMAGGTLMVIGERRVLFEPKQVTAGYFPAIGATALAGRLLADNDAEWRGVVVNIAFVRRFWPHLQPPAVIGQTIGLRSGNRAQTVVVGVVPNVHDRALDRPPSPAMYRLLDTPRGLLPHHFLLRLRDGSKIPDEAVRQAVAAGGSGAVVVDLAWMYERLAGTINDKAFATLILILFSIAAVGVTVSGLAGVITFVVARRTREVAIRRALGARSGHIVSLVIVEAANAAAAGIVAGLLAGKWLSHLLGGYLFNVAPADPWTLAAAACGLVFVLIGAGWVPTHRAVALPPADALRLE